MVVTRSTKGDTGMTETATRVGGFIVMTRDMHWAWGTTPEDAIKSIRRANRSDTAAKRNRVVYQLPPGAIDGWVDQMGQINWDWADDAPDRHALGVTIEAPPE